MTTQTDFAHVHFDEHNTPYSEQFDDIYFMPAHGLDEARYVFLDGNQLLERWQTWHKPHFVIAETGFGTGLNFLACCALFDAFRAQHPDTPLKRLFFISFEKFPLTRQALTQSHRGLDSLALYCQQLTQQWVDIPITGCHRCHFGSAITLDLWLGDLHDNLPELGDYYQGRVDAWFLDGFAPSKNPDMWNDSLYQQMFRLSHQGTTFATFTAASKVRLGLEAAGFTVRKRKGFAHKREMLIGFKPTESAVTFTYPWSAFNSGENTRDVAIIGGGVASLFTALALRKRGIAVTLYCQDDALGQGASGNAQGALYPQLSDDDQRNCAIYAHSFLYAKRILPPLCEQLGGVEQGWHGVALCAYNCKVKQKLAKIASHWPPPLFELKSAQALTALCGIEIPHEGGFIASAGWLSPKQLMQRGARYLQKCGVNIITRTEIEQLSPLVDSRWQLDAGNRTFTHDAVVLACGHKLTHFSQTEKLPLYPVRGQVSYIPTTPALQALKAVVCFDGYLTPHNQQQQHCLGASHVREQVACDFSAQEQQANKIRLTNNIGLAWAQEIDISGMQGNVGVRCGTRERLPMMGNVPHFDEMAHAYANLFNLRRRQQPIAPAPYWKNLYLLGALGSRGLTSAPLLAESLASLVANEPIPLAQSLLFALNPNRTWVRKLLKGTPIK
ncbi:bifunctional tRNA (5-methylaminomethyl-2-thiouridine)(34)-methyltransferase MnmD/FAD-dependent 5-carboxymethylaminomethyl-2-thiouridine(34) oxidoreductase MnmC [Pasteurellaceae bacterium HPA106]|uniref:bifunctional tRNA (5-methylaminomethyl-2-thiouridine)(34)-methyltransferase MnmD/FAD-dependent 5-carboxymethylaminomethyl-2-thiouridine(34) oxidoreductase MnmC n=1 Tax=Spirabiliibacterium pneumoniae TaxID=221400 RepID=UPI001AADDB3C|nr:bifunctional tRNA (5-methylaminomethyl-2-thiouridine)(34)-methyltransferase MnmD/FAD-dependent 5-carboxymethylaminomethyl-2-thiouridine(34) oxidoreductase MnmC [Spirabiliibacterium pneumoniae]MBE2896115.1 bifunctional tRNA (5-methylaminomethyl-2-thiouridine)(34)-methyltransferase MnmD/FAD-dependent 5-carboxymethylaminomethyl-2-thiouridine(34) oxidoreductase MnmC [Spirabiliibacterium pneumoniae]